MILLEHFFIIRDEIDNTEPVSLSADSIDLNAGINFCSVNDKIVGVLGGYANTTELDAALDLFFRYYLKRPDIFIQFYHAANMFYGIQVNSADNAFYTPISFIKKAVEYADNWNNRFILLLFVAVAQKWLDLSFSPVESGRKRNSMVIRQFSLHSAEGVSEYRTLIWEQLLIIASQGKCLETMRDIVRNYGFGNEECTYGVIQTDEPYLCRLLEMLYPPDCLEGCIIADRLDQVFSSASVTSLELSVYLKSEKLSLYQTLCDPKWIEDTSFDSHETKRNDNILAYFNSKASRIEAFDCVFDLYAELLTCENQRSYDMGRGFSYAIDIMSEEKSDYLYAAKRLIGSEDIYGIDPNYIVRKLFSFLKARDCFEMINGYKTAAINHWQFAFFNELPVNEINNSWVKELYIFFRDDSDKTIKRSGIRDLSF